MKKNSKETINDLVYFDNLKIVQNEEYFKFSLDSILLPNFCQINPNTKKILDLCTGNAPIPLVLSTMTKSKIIGIELQKEVFLLADKSIILNNKQKQIEIINEDAKNSINLFETDTFDLITCNPPYFKYTNDSIINESEIKSIARHEKYIKLTDIFNISKKLLKNNGSICLVHRTDRLMEILKCMKDNNIEPKRIRFIYPKKDKESNLVLVDGRKNGRTGMKILPPLYIHNDDGTYTSEVIKMFGGKNDSK